MNLPSQQRGLGMWGWLMVMVGIGGGALVVMKATPIFLAEMAIQRIVKNTAQDPGNGSLPLAELRRAMRVRWDVEGITTLGVNDISVVKHPQGRALSYDYEARTELFPDVYLVFHFYKTFPMKGGGPVE